MQTNVEVNVRERILKPIGEVFAAVVDPAQMSKYFTSAASGPMAAGKRVEWEFADVGAKGSVDVLEVEREHRIVFEWGPGGDKLRTTITFLKDEPGTTVVTINERSFAMDQAGVKRAMGQTAGWTYFLACLKAYVTHGIQLRLGLNKKLTDVTT
jgi:uncharacterized protein YndB with AHSA1/START domain